MFIIFTNYKNKKGRALIFLFIFIALIIHIIIMMIINQRSILFNLTIIIIAFIIFALIIIIN